MGVVTARLLFLAFLALTATIIYNALYLQEPSQYGMAEALPGTPVGYAATRIIGVEPQDAEAARDSAAAMGPAAGSNVNAASPTVTDRPAVDAANGESRLVVSAIQRELSMRGYDVGAANGELSDETRNAISQFQMREGLAVTGLPSDDVLRQILLGDTIAASDATGAVPIENVPPMPGEDNTVERVQQVLAELGYAPGAIDGAWGQNTADAVRAFQRDRGMSVTGELTPELLAELERVTGRDFAQMAVHR